MNLVLTKTYRSFYQIALLAIGLLSASLACAGSLTVTVLDKQGKPVNDAVVYLETKISGFKSRIASLEISQKKRRFSPIVTVAQTGSTFSFPNNDTVQHHVYSFSAIKRFELKLYAGTPSAPIVFEKAGTIVLGCNIHDSMVAYIQIVDTPLFGKTDSQGKLHFSDLPDGEYVVKTWHFQAPNDLATKPQTLQLKADAALNIELPYYVKEVLIQKPDSTYQ